MKRGLVRPSISFFCPFILPIGRVPLPSLEEHFLSLYFCSISSIECSIYLLEGLSFFILSLALEDLRPRSFSLVEELLLGHNGTTVIMVHSTRILFAISHLSMIVYFKQLSQLVLSFGLYLQRFVGSNYEVKTREQYQRTGMTLLKSACSARSISKENLLFLLSFFQVVKTSAPKHRSYIRYLNFLNLLKIIPCE